MREKMMNRLRIDLLVVVIVVMIFIIFYNYSPLVIGYFILTIVFFFALDVIVAVGAVASWESLIAALIDLRTTEERYVWTCPYCGEFCEDDREDPEGEIVTCEHCDKEAECERTER